MNRKLHLAASLFSSAFVLLAFCGLLRTAAYEAGTGIGFAIGDLVRRVAFSPASPLGLGIHTLPSVLARSDFWGVAFLLSFVFALFWLRRTRRLYATCRHSSAATSST